MTVTLPAGNPGVGDISVTITSDVANAVAEENASGTAETNNEATFAFQSALAPFRSEEHTSGTPVTNAHLVCRLLLEKKNNIKTSNKTKLTKQTDASKNK